MEFADSHCHIQSLGSAAGEDHTRALWAKSGETSAEPMLARAHANGVTRLLCVGCDVADSQLAVQFVQPREGCWASIGIHPHEASRVVDDAAALDTFAKLAAQPKVVAVGECGLDYFYEHSDKPSQQKVLGYQIELAIEHDLPVVFHVRDAFDDFWPIFERYVSEKPIRGVLHSFTDSKANLERALGHGLYIGVNGIATFTKDAAQQAMYRAIPLAFLLLETDAPFLTPAPFRGKINESTYIRTIAEFLAGARGESLEEVAQATTQNFSRMFRIEN